MNERRRERSMVPARAAQLYLQAAARRGGHSALALADADGLLVVDNNSSLDTEAVAAVAPLASRRTSETDGFLRLVTRGQPLRVWNLLLDGATYYLAGVGGHADAPKDAADALSRILLYPSLPAEAA